MKKLKNILDKELLKVSSLNGISVLIKIGVGFLTSKMLAIFVGPAGMALVGNLRNFITTIENIGTLGFQNGIIKYLAEYEEDIPKLRKIVSTVLIVLVPIVLLLSGFLYFFSSYLNDFIFGSDFKYKQIFVALALSLPWYLASVFLISVLNGFGVYKKVISIAIYGNIIGLILSLLLVYYYQVFGALLAVVLGPAALFLIVVFQIKSEVSLIKLWSSASFDFSIIKDLSQYSLMALVSSVFGPLVFLSIRNAVIHNLGIEKAGYWEALSMLSSYYFLFLSTILTIYFLPKLSKATNNKETKDIYWICFKGVFPFFAIALIVVYHLRNFIIALVFTKDFTPISDLFFWQITGDLFKALSLILGYQFFAKKLTVAFIVSELFSLLVFWISSHCFIKIYDIEGVVIAHALTYAIYLSVLILYFRKSVF